MQVCDAQRIRTIPVDVKAMQNGGLVGKLHSRRHMDLLLAVSDDRDNEITVDIK